MAGLTIAALARAADVGVETVRFYQRRGLMPAPPPRHHGDPVRRYGADEVRRLRFIRAAKAAGLQLAEIQQMLALDPVADRPRIRALAEDRMAMLDRQIAALAAARAVLAALASDCAASTAGPCPIVDRFADAWPIRPAGPA